MSTRSLHDPKFLIDGTRVPDVSLTHMGASMEKRRAARVWVDKRMKIEDVVQTFPETIHVFTRYGVACVGCSGASFDNIEVGAKIHGIDVEQLLADLNATIASRN